MAVLAGQPGVGAHADILCGVDMSCLMHLSGLATTQGRPVRHQHAIQILRDTLIQS